MSSINLGGFNSTATGTTGLGFLSNLDSEALIEAALSGRQSTITANEDKIAANIEKISAVGQLETLLDRLKTTTNFLRSPPGILNANNDFFKHTTTSLSSNTSIAASSYLSVTSEAGATLGSYAIDNISLAVAHQLRKDGFVSKTASVVGNASVIDNYQASLGAVSGNVLNSSTPITFANDVQGDKATIDIVFGSQNEFENGDTITFRDPASGVVTTVGFDTATNVDSGSTLGIQDDTTLALKVAHIATYMNSITVGDQSTYTYTASEGILTVTRDTDGSDSEVGTDLTIEADFSTTSTTQTIKIGDGTASNNPSNGTVAANGTDGNQGTVAKAAVLNILFGTENRFDATDELTVGATTITFGGTGDNDIDISSDTTLDDKIDAIVTRLNAIATGSESTYTYSRDSTGILTITQDTTGTIASTGNDINVSANFSKGTGDITQTVSIGKNYKNNASTSGSVAKNNGLISGSVSANGIDGYAAATKATINVQIANNNIDATDSITFGATTITFGGVGDDDIVLGGSLVLTLENIVKRLNDITTGDEAEYSYESNGVDSIIVTRDVYGDNATVDTSLAISSDFFVAGADDITNTVKIGSASATNAAQGPLDLNTLGTDGVNQTAIADASTTHISTLSGAITIDSVTYIAGSSTASTFKANALEFKATVGGVTYTSRPVELDGGDINATGAGDNFLGNRIPSGTVITFVKETDGDTTANTKDVTFQLTVGDEATNINNSGNADTYATSINTWLNTTNTIAIAQNPTIPEFRAGTFSLGGVDISLTEGDNLQVIKSKINAVSASSGVSADIVQISDSNFSLILKASTTGADNKIFEYSDGDVGDGPTGTIQIGLDNIAFTEVAVGSNASFDLDGQTITRATNTINDVVDKLTFSLNADTPALTSVNINVRSDNELIKSGISDFLTAYNELKFFIASQTERDANNDLVETAILGDESVLRDVITTAEAQLTRTIGGISTAAFNSLFEVGIDLIDFPGDDSTPETKDIFIIDEDKFDAAIASNFSAVRDVFAFTFTANSPELSIFSHTNKTTLVSYKLDIDTSRADGDKVRVLNPADNSLLFNATLDGNSIRGQAGTTLEGIVLVYTGDGTDIITVNQTRGVASGLHNILEGYLKADGFVDDIVNAFKSKNDRLQERIDNDNEILLIERQLLVDQFTRLEAVISQANSTISFLDSQNKANNNS